MSILAKVFIARASAKSFRFMDEQQRMRLRFGNHASRFTPAVPLRSGMNRLGRAVGDFTLLNGALSAWPDERDRNRIALFDLVERRGSPTPIFIRSSAAATHRCSGPLRLFYKDRPPVPSLKRDR